MVGWLAGFEGGYVVLLENKTQGLSLGLEKEWSEPDENMKICKYGDTVEWRGCVYCSMR